MVVLSHFGPFWAFFDPFWPFGWGATTPSGSGAPKVGPRAKVASRPPFGAIFGHFEPFWALRGFFYPFWSFGWGATVPSGSGPPKVGGSRGPKWRLDPILGPFLAIFGPFGPFLTLFGIWVRGNGSKCVRIPLVGVKWGGESKLVGPEGPSGVQTLFWGHFGHFEPFLALLGLF